MAVTLEDELLEAKDRLKGNREIDCRQATRGAYYAAFHALQNVVAQQAAVLKFDGGEHEQVIANLKHYASLFAQTDTPSRIPYGLDCLAATRTLASQSALRPFQFFSGGVGP